MKGTIDQYIRRLNTSLGKSALLNVTPGPKTTSRLDLASFTGLNLDPAEILRKVLFEPPYKAVLDLRLLEPAPNHDKKRRQKLYAIARNSLEKKSSFIFRETGFRSLWMLYPVVYMRGTDEAGEILSPVYLWPIILSTGHDGFGSITMAKDKDAPEPVFNKALSVWIAKTFSLEIDDGSANDLVDITTGNLQDRLSELFSKLGENEIDLSGQLQPLPQKKDLKDSGSVRFFNSAVIGIVQWHNQELMQDLDKIKTISLAGTLNDKPVGHFLTGTSFQRKEISIPPEHEQFLVHPTDYTQEQAIWQSKQVPGCVIDGPPGTGKSQTIVNIVADALASKQRILILCQKRAALDVVAKRLNAVGLQDYYLCIHDPEADRKKAIQQIKVVRHKAKSPGHPGAAEEHDSLSRQITELEDTLDNYHKALFEKDARIGLSYRDVITSMQGLRGKNPGIKPMNDLAELLKGLDVHQLADLGGVIRKAQQYWEAADPLNNPWVNARSDFDLDPFQLDAIVEALANLKSHDQEHLDFVRKYGTGCIIDVHREDFVQRLEEQRRVLDEALKIENMLDHLLAWATRMAASGLGHAESVKQSLEEAIRVCVEAKDMPVDGDIDSVLGHLASEELDSFLPVVPEILYYRKKWWRSFSNKFTGLQFKLKPLFRTFGAKFSFERLDEVVPYLQAKLKSIQKRNILYEVFGDDAGPLLDLPPAELPEVLSTKKDALTLYTWLDSIREEFPWATEAWEAAASGVRENVELAAKSLEVGLDRARVAQALLVDLQVLGKWLNEPYLDMLRQRVAQGGSLSTLVTALHSTHHTIAGVLDWRNAKRFMDPLATKAVDILEQSYREHFENVAPGESNAHPSKWWTLCLVSTYRPWEKEIKSRSSILQQVNPDSYGHDKQRLASLLERKRDSVVPAIGARLNEYRKEAASLNWGPLLHIAGKGSKRLREVVELGNSLGLFDLVPCWMMNPNTASRLFPLKEAYFDVVVFDEASQCPIEQAIPAIYRSKRIVVAGDEQQLPPTSFFHSTLDWQELEEENEEKFKQAEDLDDDEKIERTMRDLGIELAQGVEDLLEASKPLLPRKMLKIHYRSKWPELIQFSNHAFYGGELQVPPAARERDGDRDEPIKLRQLPDGIYVDRTNVREAETVVEILDEIFRRPGEPPTIGVVTFNQPQSELIEEKLDEHASQCDEFRVVYEQQRLRKDDEQDVGLFVKNLENVQGDERDVMIFSTTFGRKEPGGPFHKLFGPINFQGGERRLNVAITRSRLQKIIVTSMPIDKISPRVFRDSLNPGEQYSGRDYLHLYLRYAQAVSDGNRGKATAREMLDRARKLREFEGAAGGGGDPESEFELQIKESLERRFVEDEDLRDLTLDAQVGCKGFRIDLAVRRRESSGYLMGIECDGETYHDSQTARFRDIWRQGILEAYGWKIHRIWSPKWWQDPKEEIDKVVAGLKGIM